ncbi:hypothetical protein HPB50_004450 [Hyalomma asiaticum]|uniref:Uncharacterized protein n=1 Tax=Hyalomma asiaticum TaxID=266040 RepID=A0ACB7TF28_HYAAI|nr:hypothetical protein HPB50_004450 [Hyalomma asiaticum]
MPLHARSNHRPRLSIQRWFRPPPLAGPPSGRKHKRFPCSIVYRRSLDCPTREGLLLRPGYQAAAFRGEAEVRTAGTTDTARGAARPSIISSARPSARAVFAGGSAFHRCMHDRGPPVACCSIALDANGSIDLPVRPLELG